MGRRPTISSLLLASLLAATLLLAISPAIPDVLIPPGPPGKLVRWLNAGAGEAEAAGSVVVQEVPLTSGGAAKTNPDIHLDVATFQQSDLLEGTLRAYAVRVGTPTPWPLSPEGTGNQFYPRLHGTTAVWADKRLTPGLYRSTVDPPSVPAILDVNYTGSYLFEAADALGYYKLTTFVADEFGVGNFHLNLRSDELNDGDYTLQVAINKDASSTDQVETTVLATQWPGLTVTVKGE